MNTDSKKQLPSVYPKGIFMLPSILTGINIVLGFYSIILVLSHIGDTKAPYYFYRAGLLIIIGAFFDAIDGRVARLTKTTSPFGAQLDSIADVVSFGIAPGILVYSWALNSFERFGWIAALIYLLSGAVRLARFNVLDEVYAVSSSQYFIGLPIPAAAISISLMVMLKPDMTESGISRILALCTVYLLAWLMVSRCRFRSFKDIDWKRRRPVGSLVITIILIAIILHDPVLVLSILMFSYVASGFMMRLAPQWMRQGFERLDKWFTGIKVLDDSDHNPHDSEDPENPLDRQGESDENSGFDDWKNENSSDGGI
ncbi:MAG: CDP-diacylglycerol--serine O-phosphatidyltransferase [bacterium]